MKTLRLTLTDLELGPLGDTHRVTGEAWARYTREVRTTDGALVVLAQSRKTVPATGVVEWSVLPNDDPTVHPDDAGFGIEVGWDLYLVKAAPPGRSSLNPDRLHVTGGRTIAVTSAEPDLVHYATKATAVPADPLTSYVTEGALAAALVDAGVDTNYPARLLKKVKAGTNVKVTVLGDSVLQGSTAGNPGTNDAVSLFCTNLASRFGVTVTKDNQAQGGRTAAWERIEKWSTALAANADLYVIGITGKNDITWEVGGTGNSRATGYKTADSLAQLEAMVRELLTSKPAADIMIVSGNPYGTAYTTANTYQKRYSDGLAALASAYGLAYADGWNLTPRATGSPDAASPDYLSDGVHPNTAGHAVIADAMLALVPTSWTPALSAPQALASAAPPATAVNPVRHNRRGLLTLSTASTTARTDRLVNPSFTGAWTAGGAGPWTSTTAGALAEFQAKCSDLFLLLTCGAGQGVVDVIVDGQVAYAALDLSTITAGKWITAASGLTPGVHNMTIRVVSGSVTIQQVGYTSAACEYVAIRDARVTTTSLGATNDLNQYWAVQANSVTATTTVAFEFVGTGLTAQLSRSATGAGFYFASMTIDGAAVTTPVVPTAFAGYGSVDLVKGLEYGRHAVVLTLQATGIAIGGFSVIDERPELHPYACEGMAKVGETVRFPFPWTDTPTVAVTSTTANPAGASTVTASSFVVTGTAGDLVKWRATSQQRGVF